MGEKEEVKVVRLEEKDYRGILAILWTIGTLLMVILAILRGWAPEQILTVLGLLTGLDIVFIKAYFEGKN